MARLELDPDGRRVVRQALKRAYAESMSEDRDVIDRLLEQLKERRQ